VAEILLDSDVIIAWLRGNAPFVERIPELLDRGEILVWTPISVAEIFAGTRKHEEVRIQNLFSILETLPLSAEAGRKAGHYLSTYSKSHSVRLGDALIAATARLHGMPLWTLNKKHYPMKDIRFYGG
jgi:predicted nucleic acid-binding protein